jgi:hypothetical protein
MEMEGGLENPQADHTEKGVERKGQKSSVHEIVSATQKNNFKRMDMSARRTKCTGRGSMAKVSIIYSMYQQFQLQFLGLWY